MSNRRFPRHPALTLPMALLWLGLLVAAGLLVLAGGPAARTALAQASPQPERRVIVFEDPSAALLDRLSADAAVDVRWVEDGLVVAEMDAGDTLRWPGRVVGVRGGAERLAILRETDRRHFDASKAEDRPVLRFVAAHSIGMATSGAGGVTLLVASPGAWPRELLGCHGGLALPAHQVDPRTLLDRGPPEELAAWVLAERPFSDREQDRIRSVSAETLQVYWDALRRNAIGLPADRWAFGSELADEHIPRLQALMQRLVQGIPGAAVELQPFTMQRVVPGTPADTLTITTHNVIAHLPGTVPGTGTFVVGAHLDATGTRSQTWREAKDAGIPIATPGAEDNATGVASVLELLRNVTNGVRGDSLAFAFDLEFVAFSGEEVFGPLATGLMGSMHYVDARRDAGTKLLGMLNMDMVGSDSLGNNLQVTHNRASTWMKDLFIDAVSQVDPPIDLTLTPERDESLASDHNSFWIAGTDALMGADAPVDILRHYASYHRPSDTGGDVSIAKVQEVTRAFLAVLMRFDTQASAGPEIVFPPEKLRLRIAVQGQEFTYDPRSSFHTLYPGDDKLKAEVAVYNTGAVYNDTLWVEMQTILDGTSVLDTMLVQPLVTGDRVDIRLDPVPLRTVGSDTLVARVVSRLPGGGLLTQSARIDFDVSVPPTATVQPVLGPNPCKPGFGCQGLEDMKITAPTNAQGMLQIRVYDLEGDLVSSRQVPDADLDGGVSVLGPGDIAVVSGVYLVEVQWTGDSGGAFHAVLTAVVVQ